MMDSWHLFKIFYEYLIFCVCFLHLCTCRYTYSCLCYDIDCSRKHAICCICILHIVVSWSDFASPWLSDQPPIVGSGSSVSRGPSKERLQSPLGAQRLGVQKPKNLPLVPCESKKGGVPEDPNTNPIWRTTNYSEVSDSHRHNFEGEVCFTAWHNLNKSCLVSQFIRSFCFRMLAEMIIRQFEGAFFVGLNLLFVPKPQERISYKKVQRHSRPSSHLWMQTVDSVDPI